MDTEEIRLQYRGNDIAVRLEPGRGLSLWVNGCLRKLRPMEGHVYLWTNIELDWEEHHYLEVYFNSETGMMKITANGKMLEGARLCSEETQERQDLL